MNLKAGIAFFAGLFGLLALAAWALTTALAPAVPSTSLSARRSVVVEPSNLQQRSDWVLGNKAILTSRDRRTELMVWLRKTLATEKALSLTATFDGSGGGEAKLVTCVGNSRPSTASDSKTQNAILICSSYVKPDAVLRIEFVYIEMR